MSEAYSQGLSVHVWLCHHAGIIKVIDLPCSIMRAGAATVTFGRKCHSTLNDDSDDRPYFGGHFSNMDTLFSQKPGREKLTQQNRERGVGGGSGKATVVVGRGKVESQDERLEVDDESERSKGSFWRDDQESLGSEWDQSEIKKINCIMQRWNECL